VAEVEDEIVGAGAQIVWVLEQDPTGVDGTAITCASVMDDVGSGPVGVCVGDGETQPVPGTFDDSPFSLYRGFDMVMPRRTMEILWTTTHGTPSGNDNLEGTDVLDAVRQVVDER
jgi:hypothetical protein